jgi:hypothetical protein
MMSLIWNLKRKARRFGKQARYIYIYMGSLKGIGKAAVLSPHVLEFFNNQLYAIIYRN